MNPTTLEQFWTTLREDPALRRAFVEFAGQHGFDLALLTDTDLDDVAGGIGTWPTPERPFVSYRNIAPLKLDRRDL